MKILYLVHQFFPEGIYGTERFTFNLASAIQAAGHEVRVVTYTFDEDAPPYHGGSLAVKDYVYKDLPVTAFKLKKMPEDLHVSISKDEEVYAFAGDLWDKGRYDLLHVTHPMRTTPFIFAAIKKKVPYVISLTDFFMICYRGFLINRNNEICSGPEGGSKCREKEYFLGRRAQTQAILSHAALVVAPSQFVVDLFQKEFPHIAIKIIPHGINYRYIFKNDKLYSSDSAITFGFMGALAAHKGVHLLIEAFKQLENQDCRLKIHGAPFNQQYAEQLKAMAAGDKRIELGGAYSLEEDINGILNDIDVLCVPSQWHEPYGLVIQEAFAAGVPVIGSRRGGIPEIVTDGVNGFIFDPAFADNLYKIMDRIVKNPPLLHPLKKEITPPPIIEEEAITYEQIYRKVINKSKDKIRRWWGLFKDL